MNISAIVYRSNAGHTERYAKLLGESCGLPAYTVKEAAASLAAGEPVIFMGWLMGGGVMGLRAASKRFDVKAVCAVGMAGEDEGQLADIKKNNALGTAPLFYLQGGFELDKLKGVYRFMMNAMRRTAGKALQNKADRTPQEDEMLELMMKGGDRVDAGNLDAILAWYRG